MVEILLRHSGPILSSVAVTKRDEIQMKFSWKVYVLQKFKKSFNGGLFGLIDTDKIKRTRVHMKQI